MNCHELCASAQHVRRRKKRSARARRLGRALGRWTLVVLVGGLAISMIAVWALRFIDPPMTSLMFQRQSEARRQGNEGFVLKQHWVALSQLPDHVGLAVISSEDQRFFKHWGFDTAEIERALGDHLRGEPLRGASTLSQQVAKNLFLWEGRSFARKVLEAYFTFGIELLWSKRRILEVYLNVAEFGPGVFGVGAAARHHFDCDARRISVEQSALLAAILPSPLKRSARHPSPRVLRKQRWILEQLHAAPSYAAWEPLARMKSLP
jgi:monofunctional biosynthetic peptidoglycan transglycosylase